MINYVQPGNDPVGQEEYWINPIGGLGDTLMLSGVLKQHIDLHPERQFNLVRRKGYLSLLKGHPAIKQIGHPPADARLLRTDYWAAEPLGANAQRAYQVLARAFGLPTPVPESLFVPGAEELDPFIEQTIPWRKKNLVFAPFSESVRKSMHPSFWSEIIRMLAGEDEDLLILQVGRVHELHIKNTYSLLGVTSPKQLIALLSKCNVVLTADNFIMHAAHLTGTPAVVLWGPTPREVYGYDEHIHIQAPLDHCPHKNECIGTRHPENYARPCPLHEDQCMNKIPAGDVCKSIKNILTGSE
ncbi:glycosyltransferase family 9 protein [Bacteroidota bacterium]